MTKSICPYCRGNLRVVEGVYLDCPRCRQVWPVGKPRITASECSINRADIIRERQPMSTTQPNPPPPPSPAPPPPAPSPGPTQP